MLLGLSMLWLVLALALVPGSVLSNQFSPLYTNHWAVRVEGGSAEAESIAAKFGFTNLGQVSIKNLPQFGAYRTSVAKLQNQGDNILYTFKTGSVVWHL